MRYQELEDQIKSTINTLDVGTEFYLKDIINNPQAHIGTAFRKAVDKGLFPNVEFVDCDGDADKYRIK